MKNKKTKLGEYDDLYVHSDTLLFPDVFQDIRNMCFEIYKLDPAKFLSDSGLASEGALKKTSVKLDLLTDSAMLIMVERVIKGGIYYSIYQYAKYNSKFMKDYDENKELWYTQYWDENNFMVGQVRKSFQ